MMKVPGRKAIITVGATGAVGLAGFGAGTALEDPEERIGTVRFADVASQAGTAPGTSQQVPGLDELSGRVTRDDDIDELDVAGVDLDFGPDRWIATGGPLEDFDGDGAAEGLWDELDGLVGSEVRFRVLFDDEGDDADVYVINDFTYREVSGPAPWQAADAVGEYEIRRAAAAAVGDGARVTELEAEDGDTVAWEAEVIDRQGADYDVLLDAAGGIIDARPD